VDVEEMLFFGEISSTEIADSGGRSVAPGVKIADSIEALAS
jgi:hypothetical protein